MAFVETKPSAQERSKPTRLMAGETLRIMECIAKTDGSVLVMGEHGVGKRTAAREIHARSQRSREPYRELDCRDLDAQSLRATLEMPGTIYFWDVADLDPALQELLRETCFTSNRPRQCRIIFGSCRELPDEVKAGRMPEDFYYLVSAITIRLLPLRLQKAKIPGIADALVAQYAKQFGRPKPVLGDEINQYLLDYNWPDNFPELQTALKTFVAIGDQTVSLAALKAAAGCPRSSLNRRSLSLKQATKEASLAVERRMISQVLGSTRGHRKRAATELGISYKALLYKIKQFGLGSPAKHDGFGVAV